MVSIHFIIIEWMLSTRFISSWICKHNFLLKSECVCSHSKTHLISNCEQQFSKFSSISLVFAIHMICTKICCTAQEYANKFSEFENPRRMTYLFLWQIPFFIFVFILRLAEKSESKLAWLGRCRSNWFDSPVYGFYYFEYAVVQSEFDDKITICKLDQYNKSS